MSDDATGRPSREQAEEAVRTLLAWLGDDPSREGLLRTPTRVLNCYEEWYSGYDKDPGEVLGSVFPDADGFGGMVTLTNINFESHCEHHMAAFVGKAHVAYVPDGRVVGVSKIVKVINIFAKRLQVQEKLTKQVAECIYNELKPRGVAVVMEAAHGCMTTRGVYQKDIKMVSSTLLGCFEDDVKLRDEFMREIGGPAS